MKFTLNGASRNFIKNYRKRLNAIFPYKQKRIQRNHVKISAYMSIYNDGDFIVAVLENLKNYVDELVVVDGAFEWMVPYLEQLGVDPMRSGKGIYEAINASGIPYRTISQTWKNELEKRKAGYEQCSHRYVMRIDADEVMFFNDELFEGFLGSGCAVAEMQFPLYLAPGWVIGVASRRKYPAQCLLFDSSRISANKHLEYLWLVIPADNMLEDNSVTYPIYEKPVAFCAHLSVWRSADAAANRAVFYVSNWIRKHGVPWVHKSPEAKRVEFSDLFNFIPASEFRSAMQRSHVAFGATGLSPNEAIAPTPLTEEQERRFVHYFHSYISGLNILNEKAAESPQPYIFNVPVYFDISSKHLRQAITSSSDEVCIQIPPEASKVSSSHITMKSGKPYIVKEELPCNIEAGVVTFNISPYAAHDGILRQFVEVRIGVAGNGMYGYFQVLKPSHADSLRA